MIAYYTLIAFPIILEVLFLGILKKKNYKTNALILFAFFAIFSVLLSIRDYQIGYDTNHYRFYFETIKSIEFHDIFSTFTEEYGFYIFLWIIARLFDDFRIFLTIVAVIFVFIPLFTIYKNETRHPVLVMSVFMGMCPFAFYFSGMSQVTAMAFAIPIYYAIKKKKIILGILLVIIATMFHSSSVFLLSIIPISFVRLKNKYLILSLIIIIIVFALRISLFTFASSIISKYVYYLNIVENGSYTMLIAYIIIFLSLFILPKQENDQLYFSRNVLFLMICIQCMAPISHIIMRMNYYLLIFLPVIASRLFDEEWIISNRIKKFALVLICAFFIIYFFNWGLDADNLNINPYVPFWYYSV